MNEIELTENEKKMLNQATFIVVFASSDLKLNHKTVEPAANCTLRFIDLDLLEKEYLQLYCSPDGAEQAKKLLCDGKAYVLFRSTSEILQVRMVPFRNPENKPFCICENCNTFNESVTAGSLRCDNCGEIIFLR